MGRDNERKDGNPQASGTIRLRDSLNTVLLRDGGMNDAHTCETQRHGEFLRRRKVALMADGGETFLPETVMYLGLNSLHLDPRIVRVTGSRKEHLLN